MDNAASPKSPQQRPAMDVRTAPSSPTSNLHGGLAIPPPEDHPAAESMPPAQQEEPQKQKTTPYDRRSLLVIAVAVLVGLMLIIMTVIAYQQSKKEEPKDSEHSAISDVDQAEQDVNQTLNTVDDTKDFPEAGLSDESLEL